MHRNVSLRENNWTQLARTNFEEVIGCQRMVYRVNQVVATLATWNS